ncbi:hypothetical protein P153DRAFT_390015 [Dothidotthia symphoricarpi CBS 119687]|uniref:Uncharacterized protein n=1 Tax=Dothidotthia symphoricarpi CBS 119687 TaxID=1392245 RepID=A0A6A6A051_9PLEO|nr:uncharacterized protein P153DRAFT_390015 [Dothidotthia symphoricarpi CBS 119687]KAF2125170.1 hypothetical protein P153DRAFT_390015 [Dothidotthia symphoricarpi CBS 119687]
MYLLPSNGATDIASTLNLQGGYRSLDVDAIFRLDPENYRHWSSSGFFQITLGWGTLNFTEAKTIVIAGDIIFGRGGQALLAFISWRIFAMYITTSIEVTPVTFNIYQTIFLQNETLLTAIPRTAEETSYCKLRRNVSDHVTNYGFYGTENRSSIFVNISLPPPVLNISAFHLPPDLGGSNWTDPKTNQNLFANKSKATWEASNQTDDLAWIKSEGTCQGLETYRWGFSMIQLIVMLVCLLIWTVGSLILWRRYKFLMRKQGRKDVVDGYQAIIEFADNIRVQLANTEEEDPRDVSALTGTEIRRRITKDLSGGAIAYEIPLLPEGEVAEYKSGRLFALWLSKEVW